MWYCEYADGTSWYEDEGCPAEYQGFSLVDQSQVSDPLGLPEERPTYTLPVEVIETTYQGPVGPAGPAGEIPWYVWALFTAMLVGGFGTLWRPDQQRRRR